MKTRLILLLPFLWLLIGCSDSEPNTDTAILKVSKSEFKSVNANGETITINIQSNHNWNINSNNQWCTTDISSGENNGKIKIEVSKNSEAYTRAATITVEADGVQEKISIIQNGKQLSTEELNSHHYKLPVVFHVLYKDKNNTTQYMRTSRASDLVIACNKYYQNLLGSKSIDMNLEFVLATKDPEGNTLSEPGINRIQVDEPTIDCEKFMENKDNLKYLWDSNRYINIMLYTFSNKNILGISHIPYTVTPDKLDGLHQLNFLPEHSSLSYPHCTSINNTYIYETPSIEGKGYYNSLDVVATIAHELGHYLGLFHAFNQTQDKDGNTITDICEDTDYCEDTPPYNRAKYEIYFTGYIQANGGTITNKDLPALMLRKNCSTGEESTPNNVMDYEISWVNRFTDNQRSRVRYVLTHSPLVPGPKVTRTITRATTSPQEFPMRMIK